mmetsp:Transcript_39741/g.118274  ORF Transcript_39741/g.118274 Transcript_39741/m.118274 type:complete len:206 (-) Transcript_39741:263-880(-)
MLPRPDKRMGEAGCPQSLRDGQIIVPVHMQHRYVKVLRDVVVFEFGLLIWDAVLFERLVHVELRKRKPALRLLHEAFPCVGFRMPVDVEVALADLDYGLLARHLYCVLLLSQHVFDTYHTCLGGQLADKIGLVLPPGDAKAGVPVGHRLRRWHVYKASHWCVVPLQVCDWADVRLQVFCFGVEPVANVFSCGLYQRLDKLAWIVF